MIKANKDLQDVIDNGHIIRGHAPKKYMKEGKVFTRQGNEPINYSFVESTVHENIDQNGKFILKKSFKNLIF